MRNCYGFCCYALFFIGQPDISQEIEILLSIFGKKIVVNKMMK